MSVSKFIPTIWSENLYMALDKQYIAVSHCNRDYEGDISALGSTVKICGVGQITVDSYSKDNDIDMLQTLDDVQATLTINQAKYFNFQIDDIDRAQCTPRLMDSAMRIAASALANEADQYIFGLYEQAGYTVYSPGLTAKDVTDLILKARQKLYESNVTDDTEVVLEVSPAVATILMQAKLDLASDNSAQLEKGYLGNFAGCRIYVSNNIYVQPTGSYDYHKCFMRTKRAIAFAEQLSEIEAYRPEKRFADAVKGLHLYGASVLYPKELILLDFGITAE